MPFQPGQSGNPGGRPRESAALKELAREHTLKALQTLVDALDDPETRNRVAAANALLDRGYGKPAQAMTVGNDDGKPFAVEQIVRRIVDPRD